MNAGFEKVPTVPGEGKRGSMWRLTAQALRDGNVLSTTRYRKDPKRRSHRTGAPAPNRVMSGAKGGQATRRTASRRQATLHHTTPAASPRFNSARGHRLEPYPVIREPQSPLAATAPRPPRRDRSLRVPKASPYFTSDMSPISSYNPSPLEDGNFGHLPFHKSTHLYPDIGYPEKPFFHFSNAPSPVTTATDESCLEQDVFGYKL
ncbi:hypothetical protein M8818_006562 [Zalaria obscura]|uniref:Uncharacterized protein n=1 Tax=Zalaria obscura TaxID=2024903 RepID=A0ACC3S644_9PEZI